MAYEPLTVTSFSDLLRKNSPPGQDFTYTTTDGIMRWAENDDIYQTYLKPSIKNPPPPTYDEAGNITSNKFHNPTVPVGTMVPNPVYVTDYPEYKASLDPDHLKYLGHNVEQMASDLGTGIAGGLGWMEDPDGMAKFRTNALEILSDKTKWLGMTGLYTKGLASLSKGMELDKSTPEYREAKREAKEWYGISQAYLKTGETMAAERMANSTALRGYFRWMDDQPMTVENMFHAEQFKRSMSEMLPSVLAMTAATAVTGGGAVVAGATMFALEGSGEWSEAMRILTEEGIPVKDAKGNVVMEPRYITTPDNIRIENPKFGQPLRETMSFEEAAPIAGQAALIYGGISAPLELFQIGRATRLLKIAPQARRSFILKILDKAVKKAPMTVRGAAWVTDFVLEGVEGASIEWLQTVTQMSANKAIEEDYGNNPKEALEALAHELGPMLLPNMFSEEIGMSDEAKTSFLLGFTGEAGMGAIGGPGRMAYDRMVQGRGKKPTVTTERPDFAVTPEGDAVPVPTAADIVTESDFDPITLVQAPGKTESALGYAAMLVGQATQGNPYYAAGVNSIISRAGGAGDDKINDLINRDSKRGLEERPERKAFNLLKSLENEPEIRKQVLDVINENPVLQAGVVAIDKDIVKNKLSQKDQGTATTTSQSEDVIDDIDTDEWTENMDNIEELVNAKLEEQGLAKLTVKAEKQYEAETEDDGAPAVSSDAEDIAAGKAMGLQGTDAQILTQYKKELAKTEKKKVKKIAPTKNINKESAPLQHLKDVQQQSGDAGVKAVLKGNKKKKIPQANLTTLNVLQNELFPEADRLPVNTQNREAVVDKIAHKIFSLAPTTPQKAPHKRKAPVKKKPVKAITKKKPITVEADAEDKAMAKSMGISVEDYMKTIAASEKKAPVKKGISEVAFNALTDQMKIAGVSEKLMDHYIRVYEQNLDDPAVQMVAYSGLIELADKSGKGKAIRDAIEFEPEYQAFADRQKAPAEEPVSLEKEILGILGDKPTKVGDVTFLPVGEEEVGTKKKILTEEEEAEYDAAVKKGVDIVGDVYLWSEEDQTVYTAGKVWEGSMPAATPEQMEKYPIKPLPEEAPAKDIPELQKVKLLRAKLGKARKAHDEAVEKEGFLPGEASRKTQAKIDEVTRELKAAKDEYGKATEAPAKKKTKEPLATETADKLIDDIIGAPKVNAKTKRKLESIQKESKAKADDAISKAEEIDSITEEMNDKLDDDLCI